MSRTQQQWKGQTGCYTRAVLVCPGLVRSGWAVPPVPDGPQETERQGEHTMRRSTSGRWRVGGAVLAFLVACTGSFNSPQGGGAQAAPKLTPEMVEDWMSELSNWGRWGEEDELGTLNLITPAKRKQAAALVKSGISVSLARDVEKEKAADNDFPFEHVMDYTGLRPIGSFSVDTFKVRYHGYAHTHMDAICHMFHKGKMYNGYSQEEVVDEGARKLESIPSRAGFFHAVF